MHRRSCIGLLVALVLLVGGCTTCYPGSYWIDFVVKKPGAAPAARSTLNADIRALMAKYDAVSTGQMPGADPERASMMWTGGFQAFYDPVSAELTLAPVGNNKVESIRAEWRRVLTRVIGADGFEENERPFCRSGFAALELRNVC